MTTSPTLKGSLTLPGDKSISHRALLFNALAQGTATIENLSSGQDVASTAQCLRALGVSIKPQGENTIQIISSGQWMTPNERLDCGNSGTTIRLLAGTLAGAHINATLTGDESLGKRPMKRIIEPLANMGAVITSNNGYAPLHIEKQPQTLHGIQYESPVSSAQVKSAILLAGLFTNPTETVQVTEPVISRDHTERMLSAMGATVTTSNNTVSLTGRKSDLTAQSLFVPGDISSAAFWLVGAAICPGSQITLKKVSLNPSRLGLLNVFQQAGIPLEISPSQLSAGEPYGDITLTMTDRPKGNIDITAAMVPALIDELPILTILGLFTDGTFTLRGAEELKVKESDRLQAIFDWLTAFGIEFTAYPDGVSFAGNPHLKLPEGLSPFKTHHDHRLVMALSILNLRANPTQPLQIEGQDWAAVSYPGFFKTLEQLQQS